ncbi:MAG: hypothetical protein R6W90_16825 [Ignavibacteriaceae bacterium]
MNRKLKNTLGLVILLLFILIGGGVYIFVIQEGQITDKSAKLKELKAYDYNAEQLNIQYQELVSRASILDSVLSARRFNIPANLSSIKFFDFINDLSAGLNKNSFIDVEYVESKPDKEFFFYEYKITGGSEYRDLYRLIYAIEQSKELKKIKGITLTNLVTNDKEGIPDFQVSFTMNVNVYYSLNNRFATADLVENDLRTAPQYDVFFPLIRNEIEPNIDELLDVQGAKLLALIPEGAFLADTRGNTYLLWEGEEVYLGYLTDINYERNRVSFILNKGGIIEKVDLFLEKEQPQK